MAKYIGLFNDSINEIEINGFSIMSDSDIENFEDLANSITWEFTYKVGEEELVYNSGDELLSRIEFREISTDEFKTLEKLFNGEYGIFIGVDYLESIIDEEDDDLDDEEDEDDEDIYFNY